MYHKRQMKGKTVDSCDPVEVFCRIKPIGAENEVCLRRISDSIVQVFPPPNHKAVSAKELNCTFKYVFDENASQREIYEDVGYGLVGDLVQGKDGVLFTYGVTSSGKTYTMTGTPNQPGILPHSLDTLFDTIRPFLTKKGTFRPDKSNGFDIIDRENLTDLGKTDPKGFTFLNKRHQDWSVRNKEGIVVQLPAEFDNVRFAFGVFVSYTEIYNDKVYDLLQNETRDGAQKSQTVNLQPRILRELRDEQGHVRAVYVQGVTEIEARSADEALTVFQRGQNIRQNAATSLNADSSRSHAIFTIRLVQAVIERKNNKIICDKELVACSQLSLVDLAGSERAKRTNNGGDRLKEAGCINNSLMTLRDCLDSLRAHQKNPDSPKVVPYRDSSLTRLFQTYFKGDGRVRMLVCINPSAAEYGENLKVLEFAESTQEVLIARGPQTRFNDVLASGRRIAASRYVETQTVTAEIHRKRKTKEDQDEVDRLIQRPAKFRYSSLLKDTIFETKFPNMQICGHADQETLPTLASFLQDRIQRHRNTFAELKAQELKFWEALCKFALRKQRLSEENEELRENLEVQTILTNLQHDRVVELEDQVVSARELVREMNRLLDARNSDGRLRDRVADFLKGGNTFKAKRTLYQEKYSSIASSLHTSTRQPTAPLQTSTPSTLDRRFNFAQDHDASPQIKSAARSRFELQASGQRGAFNPRHQGRRSKSADQRTVVQAHKNHVPVGSALKPNVPSSSIITQPPTPSKLKKTGKFMLINQQIDGNAEIETQLWHAKVIPTAGVPSGSAVIFESIETHVQGDAVDPHDRVNMENFRPREHSVSREEIQSRCAVSFSHKSPANKSPIKHHAS